MSPIGFWSSSGYTAPLGPTKGKGDDDGSLELTSIGMKHAFVGAFWRVGTLPNSFTVAMEVRVRSPSGAADCSNAGDTLSVHLMDRRLPDK